MQEKTKRFQIFITTYYYFIGIYKNLNTMRLLDKKENLKRKRKYGPTGIPIGILEELIILTTAI